jgi:hypothetical protein
VTVTGSDGTTTCSDDDSASVWIVPGTPEYPTDDIGTPGYVCNHVNQSKPNPFDAAEVNQWALDIEYSSRWWAEYGGDLYDPTAKFSNILAIICKGSSDAKSTLEKHLLTLWFNVADFRVGAHIKLEQLCIGPENFPAGTNMKWTIGEVITYAETALLTSDSGNYLFWKDVIDAINNSDAPGYDGCPL